MKNQALYNRQTVPGSTAALQILLVAAFAVAATGCSSEDDALDLLDATSSGSNSYTTAYTGDWNGNAGNFTSSFSPTLTGDVLSFSVAFDDSDAATYGSAAETAPTDEGDADYEDYAENFTERRRITITYADGSATATGDVGEVAIDINGADVAVTSETKGVTYVLTGSCSDGSFKMVDGEDDKKFGLILQDLTLAKAGGAAINIQPSKRCYLQVEGSNTLSNTGTFTSDEEQQKGCIFSEGKLLISGSGTLNVSSAAMHAVASDDYVWIHSGPTLNLISQGKDGIHANDSVVVTGGKTYITSYGDGIQVDEATGNYVQKGGFVRITASSSNTNRSHGVKTAGGALLYGGALQVSVSDAAAKGVNADGNITVTGGKQTLLTSGSGTYDSDDRDTKACAGLAAEGDITISGGTLLCKSSGSGGKGIKADGTLTFNDGCTVRVLTQGNRYSYSSSLHSSPKGIKSTGKMTFNGGTVVARLTGSGDGTEAIESKDAITINDGYIAASSYDDAINSKSDLTVNGGYLYAQGTSNDAIDANRNLVINGGVVLASGGAQPENALDAAEGYSIYINGGWVFGIGGSTAETASGSQQASIAYSVSASGQQLGLFDSTGSGMLYVSVPSTSCTACYTTAYGMTAGSSYTLTSGATVSGGITWCGINATGTVSGGSSLGTATAAACVGEGMGGGQPGGGGQMGGGPGGGRH